MKYFSDDEFKCKCGCGTDVTDEFRQLIGRARSLAGIPFIVTSGSRCKEHNRAVGSKDTSSHTKGIAVDIKATGSRERSLIMSAFCVLGVTRIGVAKDFIHFDIDRDKEQDVTWLYS